ncbi:MAG TPA: bifunctional phosphoribosylaminoimidazolecarboxamide formyltransferase/IMP cyclohydrolase, partial [Vicinamibacterales bacterium]|nr:bifunctional phosphoribosylaminoimidazolecarboxamide formyltransferase/IMP cyclohydrolase [Vicinamibacterales bacterium]
QHVLAVVDPSDYPRLVEQLRRPDGPTIEFRLELMKKSFHHTAEYDRTIADTLDQVTTEGERFVRGSTTGRQQLRYGENPHQKAWWVRGMGGALPWTVHQGKELSFTNLLDLDAALRIALEFTEPVGVVIKHTNPCGVATGATLAEAYVAAREADPLSAFGGIVGLNGPLDEATARAMTSTFIEAVIAPSLEEAARPVLAAKANLRVVTMPQGPRTGVTEETRSFLGGLLVQEMDRVSEALQPWPAGDMPKVVTRRSPTPDEWVALRFAWRVCAHVKSNAVVFTARDRTLSVGAGQMSRVDAVKVAVLKAGGNLRASVAASDAFFPFRDGVDAIADAGATAVVQPGGSVKDAEVVAAADERGLAMVFTGRRHFRH